LMKFIKKAKR